MFHACGWCGRCGWCGWCGRCGRDEQPGGARLRHRPWQEARRARPTGPAARRRHALAGRDPELGTVVRATHAERSGAQGVPRLPARRVLRGEHHVLAGVRGAEARARPRRRGGEGALHLRGLHLHPVAQGGVAGLARARARQPQHGGAHAAHLRRGAAADLHADAARLLPALPQLAALQGVGATARPARARPCARPRALYIAPSLPTPHSPPLYSLVHS